MLRFGLVAPSFLTAYSRIGKQRPSVKDVAKKLYPYAYPKISFQDIFSTLFTDPVFCSVFNR